MASTAKRKTTLWVASTYFAEGMPYAVIRSLTGIYLTDIGIAESALGRINFWLALPWNLKFLWAPAVDLTSTRRRWLLAVQAGLALGVLGLVAFAALGPAVVPSGTTVAGLAETTPIRLLVTLLVALAALAATHDIAIDAYYMEAIPDAATAAAYTGVRNVAYRLAVVFVRSGLVWLAGAVAWSWSFAGAAAALATLALLHAWILPTLAVRPPRTEGMPAMFRDFGAAFGSFVRQPRAPLILLFLVAYKLGDEVLFSMNTPFLKRELGVRNEDLAWIAGLVGTWASIGGSLVSAWAISRFGLRRAVWPLTLGMNINILAYVWLAWVHPDAHTASGLWTIAAVHGYEQVAAGLGNAVLVVYIMRICDVRFRAAHYAIGSAITPLGGTVFNYVAGSIVEKSGYMTLYLLAFALAIPSMLCLFALPMPEPRPGE